MKPIHPESTHPESTHPESNHPDTSRADDTVILPSVTDDHGDSDGLTKVHVLLKDTEQTQVLPRLPPAPWTPPRPGSSHPVAPVADGAPATSDQTTVLDRIALDDPPPSGSDRSVGDESGGDDFGGDDFGGGAAAPVPYDAALSDAAVPDAGAVDSTSPSPARRHHRTVWLGLVVFWLLALGAGFISLASVGARATCTTTDKGLDCTDTGSGIAIALAVCVIVLVGILSVRAMETRARARVWLRDLGLGIVMLAIVAYVGYRLIATISG